MGRSREADKDKKYFPQKMKASVTKDNETQTEEGTSSLYQHEDAALKAGMGFFVEELLPYLGIEGKVIGFAPTELVHLEMKKFLQDFNLVMEDGSWKHFEFQSTNEGAKGLRRFHACEALAEYQYNVPVTTYVLFSGTIRHPMTELAQGEYTYRIVPIIMKNRNADKVIGELWEKLVRGECLTRKDLVPLTLCLLMGGTMPLKERVKETFKITKKAAGISTEDISKIEAVVYVMADKFLDQVDMDEIKEGISMTRLGQMLVEMGRSEGRDEINKLNNRLIKEGKYKELERATEDVEYQKHLITEYGIS
jgi:DNA-binding protein